MKTINIPIILVFFILAILLLVVILRFIYIKYVNRILQKIERTEANLKEEIHTSVQVKFLETSMETKDLVDLAIEIWRIDKRLNKIMGKMQENNSKAIENSMQKIKRFIAKCDVEIRDYTGQKYSSGLSAVEVISVEKDKKINEDLVKQTIDPAILIKGQLVRKAKVVIITNN